MKKCTICRQVKEDSHFGKYPKDYCRCNVCHSIIVDADKEEALRMKNIRIQAYLSGDMPRSPKRNAVYSGHAIKIDHLNDDIKLERELKDLEL